MYTVGLDADTLVSELEEILIFKIRFLAGNSILNLSPPFQGKLFILIIIYLFLIKILENFVFSKDEIGKIYKFISQLLLVFSLRNWEKTIYILFNMNRGELVVNNTKSADCLFTLP
jgi:hypothetical protein